MTVAKKGDGQDVFARFTGRAAKMLGHAWAFIAATNILVIWAVTGPFLGFSDTWQLVINTGTTIVTFLMVFIIQNTQNRDTAALHVKLDAIMLELRVSNAKLYEAENEGEREIERQRERIEKLAEGNHAPSGDSLKRASDES
ncbi:low affinity iron permease family protein [bacterium RCC_150]